MICPECKKEMDEEFRIDSFNKIFICTGCGILKWVIEIFGTETETWKRIDRK